MGGRRGPGRPARSACTARATTATPASPARRCGPRASTRSSPRRSCADRYRGSYNGGVRYLQSLAVSVGELRRHRASGVSRRPTTREYIANASPQRRLPGGHGGPLRRRPCVSSGSARDFVRAAKGSTVPFLLTAGFPDPNTNSAAVRWSSSTCLAGPKRLWIGWWDHVRGNDMVGDRLAMGRAGWFDEVMRFYDQLPEGQRTRRFRGPVVAVQGSDGHWRSEQAWPPADAQALTAPLTPARYPTTQQPGSPARRRAGRRRVGGTPDGRGRVDGVAAAPARAHIAGMPTRRVDVAPRRARAPTSSSTCTTSRPTARRR